MAKRKLNRRQAWRVEKIQKERADRAAKRTERSEALLSGDLGPEQEGLVISHFGTQVLIEAEREDQEGHIERFSKRCHFRANLGSLVTGDKVVWRDGDPLGVVVAVLPRSSELTRPDPYGELKTVAANIDRIIIVVAPYPEAHANLIDRYLVAAETLGIEPILLINKQDRIDESTREKLDYFRQFYPTLGYQTLGVSTVTGEGLDELKAFLAQHTSVFVGQSGVGKSSLVNALLPDAQARVGELSEISQKGTHTTTTAQLFHFPGGGQLIDSPGIREFGLWHMDKQQVLEGFVEFRPFLGLCKFRDCQHEAEPGCAIQNAFDQGDISEARMNSYLIILDGLGGNGRSF